jgi:hypothetical protein
MDQNDIPAPEAETVRPARPRSKPPLIDLEAEKPATGFDARPLALALLSGMIGGGLVYAATLLWPANLPSDPRWPAYEQALHTAEAQSAKLARDLEALRASLDHAPPPPDVTALTQRLTAIEETLARPATQPPVIDTTALQRTLRLSLALALRDKLAADAPFETEYQALIRLSGSSAEQAALAATASHGAPSYAMLRAEFLQNQGGPVTKEPVVPAASASFPDRMMAMLSRFVTITDVHETTSAIAGDPATALLSALANRRGSDALALYSALSEPDQHRLAPWVTKLRHRVDAEAAAERLVSDAVQGLASAGGGQ